MFRPLFAAVLAFVVTSDPASAQATYVVGPSGFANVPLALQFALPGDVIHIEPGTYPAFDCTVGVRIRGLVPGTVLIHDPVGGQNLTTLTIPAGQTLHLTDLAFEGRVNMVASRVAMTGTSISGPASYPVYASDCDLHLVDCHMSLTSSGGTSQAAAMRIDDSLMTAVDCTFTGGNSFVTGGQGLVVNSSTVHASNVTATGEAFSFGGAIHVLHNSTVWLTDSTATSQWNCPIRAFNGAQVFVDGVVINGSGNDCGTTIPASMLAVAQSGPITAGAPFALSYRGRPDEILAVFAGQILGAENWFPVLEQISWLEHTSSFVTALTLLDGNGEATVSWNIPGGASIPDQPLWFKGISGLTLPLQSSAVAGGIVR